MHLLICILTELVPSQSRVLANRSFLSWGHKCQWRNWPALCMLEYTTVNQVADAAMQLGSGSLLEKIYIKSAYQLIPVHPRDRPAPKIFNAIADALEWCTAQRGVHQIFPLLRRLLVMGPPNWSEGLLCQWPLSHTHRLPLLSVAIVMYWHTNSQRFI